MAMLDMRLLGSIPQQMMPVKWMWTESMFPSAAPVRIDWVAGRLRLPLPQTIFGGCCSCLILR